MPKPPTNPLERSRPRYYLPNRVLTPVWAPEDGGAAAGDAGAADAAAAAAAAAQAGAGDPPAAKWFEGDLLTADERTWLGSKGLNLDDPLQAIPKLVRGHRSAEQFMGKGVERIIERPADGQAYAEWARANAAALGLPEKAEGYEIAPPESWPKDAQWDTAFEAEFRKVAFEEGLPPGVNRHSNGPPDRRPKVTPLARG